MVEFDSEIGTFSHIMIPMSINFDGEMVERFDGHWVMIFWQEKNISRKMSMSAADILSSGSDASRAILDHKFFIFFLHLSNTEKSFHEIHIEFEKKNPLQPFPNFFFMVKTHAFFHFLFKIKHSGVLWSEFTQHLMHYSPSPCCPPYGLSLIAQCRSIRGHSIAF